MRLLPFAYDLQVLVVAIVALAHARPDQYKHLGPYPDRLQHDEASKNQEAITTTTTPTTTLPPLTTTTTTTTTTPLPTAIPPTCESRIYCQGNLLHTVQMSGIFTDSKHFVDMMLLDDEDAVLQKFDAFMAENDQQPTKEKVAEFVAANFAEPNELEMWTPEDYVEEPTFLSTIASPEIRSFAKQVVAIWPMLGRRISNATLHNLHRHSLLPLAKGFVIPGGRFRETYYWDTYWIIKGLLISDMAQTARGMLDNFVTLVARFGFIPNGARVYYAQRSQPPLFAAMVLEYVAATGDHDWLKQNIAHVAQEVRYWLEKRTINVREHQLARYYPASLGPRPESYKEDVKTASGEPTTAARQRLYTSLKGGAESGWDFSARCFYDGGNLTSIDMERTLPVDLNAFLYKACHSLGVLYASLHQLDEAALWLAHAARLKVAIHDVFFHEADGTWYDFDLQLGRHRREFYVSNVAPLWVHAEHDGFNASRLIQLLHAAGVFEYDGGTPASLRRTGEQWDLPNAWPPLQAIFVQALANTRTTDGRRIAEMLAKNWITTNIIGHDATGYMFEKYDSEQQGAYGGGGEYEVQSGFGWTNGVALEFIRDYYSTTPSSRSRLLENN